MTIPLEIFFSDWLASINDNVFSYFLLLAYCFVEPVFFMIWSTTPFKALLNVRVRNNDGSKLRYRQALMRGFRTWIAGSAFGIPIICLIANVMAYSRLKQDGITSWDARGNHTVTHRKIEWWRWLVLLTPLIVLTGLIYLGTQLE